MMLNRVISLTMQQHHVSNLTLLQYFLIFYLAPIYVLRLIKQNLKKRAFPKQQNINWQQQQNRFFFCDKKRNKTRKKWLQQKQQKKNHDGEIHIKGDD